MAVLVRDNTVIKVAVNKFGAVNYRLNKRNIKSGTCILTKQGAVAFFHPYGWNCYLSAIGTRAKTGFRRRFMVANDTT